MAQTRSPTHSEPRWHVAWTHPVGEFRAELDLRGKGFTAYLPLHLERWTSRPSEASVVPLFRGHMFVRFDPFREQWRRIYRSRDIAGLIGEATERPTLLGIGIVEELIARPSPRRIADDPGSAAFPDPAVRRQHWQDLTRLSGKARGTLLLRLFGHDTMLEAA